MKKIIKRKAFNVILCIFIFSLIMPNLKVSAAKNDKYDVTINYGIDGKYRAQRYMPINIEVKNLEKDFNGEIEVRVASDTSGGYDSYSREVLATAGEDINITIPVKFLEDSTNGTVCLIEDNKVVYEKNLLISSGRVSDGNALVGLLTDDATALGYLGDITFSDSTYSNLGKMNLVKLNESILENGLNIDSLDLIIINNYNTANLKEDQYNALNNWVNNGGTLLIGAGANEGKTINNIDKSFLNISSSGTVERNVAITLENLNLILSLITFDGATVTNNSYGSKLVYSLDRGEGKILVTAFDLGLEPFISSVDSPLMLQNMLIKTFDKIYDKNYNGGYNEFSYEISNVLNTIPVENIVSTASLAVILVVYGLLIGIVLYIVLKKKNKRDLIWISIPLTAVIFTVVIYLLGSKMKIKDVVVNSVNIISTDEEGKGEINGYIGLASKNNDNIKIEKEESLEMKYISDNNNYYYTDGNYEFKNLRVKTTYTDNNSYFTVSNNNILQMNRFEVSGKEIVMPKIENTLRINSGALEGAIKNNLDADIKKLLIVSGQSVWDIGSVKKGEEISLNNVSISSTYGVQGYAEYLNNEYYESRWNDEMDPNDEKFKNIQRYTSLLNILWGNDYLNDATKLIAITDLPVDYNLSLESKSVSRYNLTAIIQDATIDFKDKDGNITFPEGYFNYEVTYVDPAVYFDYYGGYANGNGEVILDYKIDENIDIQEITIKAFTDRWGYQAGTSGEYYIYNYNTSEYEEFSLLSASYEISNDDSYAANNIIKIKMVASDSKENAAPQLIIKGVER